MKPGVVVIDVVGLVLMFAVLRMAPRAWRGEFHYPSPGIWGVAPGHAYSRTMTLVFPAFIAVAVPIFVVASLFTQAPGAAVTAVLGIAGLVWVVATLAVVLFNRPSWLVAPHQRDENGLLGELVSGSSNRRRPNDGG